eukprot:c17576_g1_i1.p1 GENE.c17576_g1_i1~~c17576_g1_i1.p1  ORF type:complete len:297 (+),score=57.16 c17576_g1_i1:40-930(+)
MSSGHLQESGSDKGQKHEPKLNSAEKLLRKNRGVKELKEMKQASMPHIETDFPSFDKNTIEQQKKVDRAMKSRAEPPRTHAGMVKDLEEQHMANARAHIEQNPLKSADMSMLSRYNPEISLEPIEESAREVVTPEKIWSQIDRHSDRRGPEAIPGLKVKQEKSPARHNVSVHEQKVRLTLQRRRPLADQIMKGLMESKGHKMSDLTFLNSYTIASPHDHKPLLRKILARTSRSYSQPLGQDVSPLLKSSLNLSIAINSFEDNPIGLDWDQMASLLIVDHHSTTLHIKQDGVILDYF